MGFLGLAINLAESMLWKLLNRIPSKRLSAVKQDTAASKQMSTRIEHSMNPSTYLSRPSAQVFRTTHDVFPRTFFRPPARISSSVSSRVARQHRQASGSFSARGRVRQPSCGRPPDGPVPRTMISILVVMCGLKNDLGAW
jgi:hypothetical protein